MATNERPLILWHDRPELQEFHRRFTDLGYENGVDIGPYRVFWEGFGRWPGSSSLLASYKAWPLPTASFPAMADQRYIIGFIRGRAWGAYEAGATWDIRPVDGVPHFTDEDLHGHGTFYEMEHEVLRARERMYALARRSAAGETIERASVLRHITRDYTGDVALSEGMFLGDESASPITERWTLNEDCTMHIKQRQTWVTVDKRPIDKAMYNTGRA